MSRCLSVAVSWNPWSDQTEAKSCQLDEGHDGACNFVPVPDSTRRMISRPDLPDFCATCGASWQCEHKGPRPLPPGYFIPDDDVVANYPMAQDYRQQLQDAGDKAAGLPPRLRCEALSDPKRNPDGTFAHYRDRCARDNGHGGPHEFGAGLPAPGIPSSVFARLGRLVTHDPASAGFSIGFTWADPPLPTRDPWLAGAGYAGRALEPDPDTVAGLADRIAKLSAEITGSLGALAPVAVQAADAVKAFAEAVRAIVPEDFWESAAWKNLMDALAAAVASHMPIRTERGPWPREVKGARLREWMPRPTGTARGPPRVPARDFTSREEMRYRAGRGYSAPRLFRRFTDARDLVRLDDAGVARAGEDRHPSRLERTVRAPVSRGRRVRRAEPPAAIPRHARRAHPAPTGREP